MMSGNAGRPKCSNHRLADFTHLTTVTGWLNVSGIICCAILLLSYVILPVEKTSRHYLSVGLVVALCLIQVTPAAGSPSRPLHADEENSWDSSCRWVRNQINATMRSRRMICIRTSRAPCRALY